MSDETPAQQQYREAVEALKKLEPWRLAEIRRELNIPEPATPRQIDQ
ncbi:MAG TPA: hypothetical protein VFS41_04575 [Edaphobacter sp.]|nr:hypothetical protein [Edaphobacter sp.]